MRRGGGRILVILGIVLALIAGAGVYVVLATSTQGSAPVETTGLVMAGQPIDQRTEILPDQLVQANWPVTIPTPVGAFASPTEVAGKIAVVPIQPGEPIIGKMVLDKGDIKESHSNASLIIEKGSIGIAMPVAINSNVANAIQAGDRVDILATFTAQPIAGAQQVGPPQTASQRLLADILILQVGLWPAEGGKGDATPIVTFQLKEQDALVLKYAMEQSTGLTLVLRPANDHQLDTLEPVTLEYINKRFGFKFPSAGQ